MEPIVLSCHKVSTGYNTCLHKIFCLMRVDGDGVGNQSSTLKMEKGRVFLLKHVTIKYGHL